MKRFAVLFLALAMTLALAACGGGSGSGSSAAPDVDPAALADEMLEALSPLFDGVFLDLNSRDERM